MTKKLLEIVPELFNSSEVLIWNFAEITDDDRNKNIQQYMKQQELGGHDPSDAFRKQSFNDQVLQRTDSRYLIGRYGEDRSDVLNKSHIGAEGRTFHLAIDIFSRSQEPVFAPCDGEIVRSDYEPGEHNYGNYLILRPDEASLPYIFLGHLAHDKHGLGHVNAGEQIARLGSFEQLENGGWGIHLHLQLLTELPPKGEAPIGYSSPADMLKNRQLFPDPLKLFPQWQIKR